MEDPERVREAIARACHDAERGAELGRAALEWLIASNVVAPGARVLTSGPVVIQLGSVFRIEIEFWEDPKP